MDLKALGHQVSERRKELGLYQKDLAQRAGISRNYLSQIERGEAHNVSTRVLSQLAVALSTTPKELIELSDSEKLDSLSHGELSTTLGHAKYDGYIVIPQTLREFGRKESLSFEVVESLAQLPRPGQEPTSVEGWQELYKAIRPFIEKQTG